MVTPPTTEWLIKTLVQLLASHPINAVHINTEYSVYEQKKSLCVGIYKHAKKHVCMHPIWGSKMLFLQYAAYSGKDNTQSVYGTDSTKSSASNFIDPSALIFWQLTELD